MANKLTPPSPPPIPERLAGTWIFPCRRVQLPDGSWKLFPGKPLQKATVAETVKLTGVPRRTLGALADCGLITRERPSPNSAIFFPQEVLELLDQTRDPDFWDEVKKSAYLKGENLRMSRPKDKKRPGDPV